MSVKPTSSRFSSICLSLSLAVSPVALGALLVTTPGCLFGSGGPSTVGQGKEQYRTGEPSFDEYFGALYELQVELGRAPEDEKEARRNLSKDLKGDPDASATMLAKRVEKRAAELAEAGTGLKVELRGLGEGTAAVEITPAGNDLDSEGTAFVAAVKKGILTQATIHNRMRKAQLVLERLQSLTPALEQQVDSVFRKSVAQKGEVRKNLADAKKLIPIMSARAQEVAESSHGAAKKLVDVCNTDDGSFNKPPPPPPPPDEEEEPPPDPKAKPKAGDKPKPPPGDKPKPPPGDKPKPPPPPPGDFEP